MGISIPTAWVRNYQVAWSRNPISDTAWYTRIAILLTALLVTYIMFGGQNRDME